MEVSKRDYKVYADIGSDRNLLSRRLTILDTGAGPNFIRESELGPADLERIRYGPLPDIRDANKNAVKTLGTVRLLVRLGRFVVLVDFIVCKTLAAPVVLGCDYCDKFVEAIRPRRKLVELDDRSMVPIVRKPMRRCSEAPRLPPSMEYGKSGGRVSPRIRVAKSAMLKAQTQTWVQVRTERHGFVVIQPNTRMYESCGLLVANGIVQVDPGSPFWILVSNFSDNDYQIPKNQVVATALPHPTVVFPNHISTAEVLGLTHVGDTDKELQTPSGDQLQTAKDRESLVDELDLAHVSEHYRAKIRSMLKKYTSMWNGKLGEISATEHHLDLVPGSRPISQPPYRAGPRTRQIEEENVSKMLEEGVIEAAQSAWASPVVLVPKPDGSLRFFIDYRKLNAVTVRDTYPLPRMDECIDSLGEANVFTTLDANSGYWQVPVAEDDQDKTAFACRAGLYRFKRMPFGLTNALATFQRTLDILLSRYKWKTCLVNLDDLIIFSQDVESHLRHVEEILKALQSAGIILKFKKYEWFAGTVRYLGHVIKPGQLAIPETQTAALREVQPPSTQKKLRSFLGLCNVYRRFVPPYSHIAAPLNAKLRKGQPVQL
ncbi:unnamed protein product [Agarophyton chilense]